MLTIAASVVINGVATNATQVTYTLCGMELNTSSSAETYKVLSQGQLPSSAGAIYTASGNGPSFIKCLILANTSASSQGGIIIYVGGTAAANQITGAFTLPANGLAILDDN